MPEAVSNPPADGPLVSAIVIFMNEERFLPEAVASIQAQSYPNWELLLVDDGSTDRSTQIARDHAQREPGRVRYLNHPAHANNGMSASRNLGLAHARGPYVGFLDADDIWTTGKLAEQVAILEKTPDAAMVYGRTLIWHSWREETAADHFYELGVPADTLVEAPRLLLHMIENRTQTPTTCNALIRKSAITQVGGFEDRFRGMFEDQVFFMKLCLARPVFVSSRCWAKYRQRPDSCSAIAERSADMQTARIRLLDWLEEYLTGKNAHVPDIRRRIRMERWKARWPAFGKLLALTRDRGVREAGCP